MEIGLKNKVVVITGAADGIGFGIANKYIQHGARVMIVDKNEVNGDKAVKTLHEKYGENKADFIKCDVTTDLDSVSKTILDKYKKVDVLINNAGILNEKALRKTIEVNLIAVMEWTMKFWEHMRKDKGGAGGTILNICSMYGFIVDPFVVYYKTSKFAVIGFTKSLGHEYNYRISGVRVLALCPGLTHTNLNTWDNLWEYHVDDMKKYEKFMPWQTSEDVGNAAVDVFLTAASGTAWVVAGGEKIKEAPDSMSFTMTDIKKICMYST